MPPAGAPHPGAPAPPVWLPYCCSIWLYSLIPADYDGATVLPHWIKHYMALGIRTANFLVLVNHNPDK